MQERAYLRDEIENALALEPKIGGRIDVEVDHRHVRLSGVVDTLKEKRLAEEIAQRFGPVELESDIAIEPGQAFEDHEVLALAQDAMAINPDLAHDVGVGRVVDGVVYLQGRVESAGLVDDAIEMLGGVPGIRDIVSEAKIVVGIVITDEDLVSGVKQALRVEPSIHEEFIDVRANNGVVTLEGSADSFEQRVLATRIAAHIPGVRAAKNYLSTLQTPTSFDEAVENELLKALALSDINMNDVRVSLVGGLAHLDGTVDSPEQRDRARRIAEALPGVRAVQNDLVVGYHIEPKPKRSAS